jgi:hypothetical protein
MKWQAMVQPIGIFQVLVLVIRGGAWVYEYQPMMLYRAVNVLVKA